MAEPDPNGESISHQMQSGEPATVLPAEGIATDQALGTEMKTEDSQHNGTGQHGQIEAIYQRLAEESVDLKTKVAIATDLRDCVEIYQTANDYEFFVNKIVPVILSLLKTVPISFTSGTVEQCIRPAETDQKLRSCLLDILLRLQTNETLSPKVEEILDTVIELIQTENEDNGVVCMKILTSLHRVYKTQLSRQVRPFFDLVVQMYVNVPQVVNDVFGQGTQQTVSSQTGTQPAPTPASTSFQSPKVPMSPATPGAEPAARPLQKSMQSFKVLAECPIIIVLMFSIHKQVVNESLPLLVPHIIEMLNTQAHPQMREHERASARDQVYTGVSPGIKNRVLFGEFIVSQVKTMSFLAYTLRAFPQLVKPHSKMIPEFVVRLLQDCPCELSGARKELLVATRHILSTDFRSFFVPKIEVLLNERVLLSDGLTAQETLRPLAYSTMADLIHHVRSELTPKQIWKTLEVYCRNLQDGELATSFQIMSAKLLSNLMERIMQLPDKQEARQIMILILNVFVSRFASLNAKYEVIMKKEQKLQEKVEKSDKDDVSVVQEKGNQKVTEDDVDSMEVDGDAKKIEDEAEDPDSYESSMETIIRYRAEPANSPLKDARYIFKNLMSFLKTVMFGLKGCNPPPTHDFSPEKWREAARGFSYEQLEVFRQLFREGIAGHLFFATSTGGKATDGSNSNNSGSTSHTAPIVSSKDEKELMEAFAMLFIHLDPASFNEIVEREISYWYDALFKNSALLHIAQSFLASEQTSANFSGLLLDFLKQKLPTLGDGDAAKTNILIRLFKLSFMAVNLFPNSNERVLQPHVRYIITQSLELSTKAEEPIAYFHLLRTLFRSIGGGRFEQLYKEVLPLLQTLLESLNKRLATARKPQEKDLFVELCLTVPVRLSVLVPHLSYLMRPLVEALKGPQELVSQGLRTLELCVDNLTASYFDPIIEPVIGEVMDALWKHLKPLPYYHQHSHTTLRVLGKLGGRNRSFLGAPTNLRSIDQEAAVLLDFKQVGSRKIRITPAVKCATSILKDGRVEVHYKIKAFEYLSTIVMLSINGGRPIEKSDLIDQIKKCRKALVTARLGQEDTSDLPNGRLKDHNRRQRENKLIVSVMEAVFECVAIEETKPRALDLIQNMCEYCTIAELGDYVLEYSRSFRRFEVGEYEGIPQLEAVKLLDVIMYALSHYRSEIREAGVYAVKQIYQCAVVVFGEEHVCRFPMLRVLYGRLAHGCFETEYYRKSGGVLGLRTLIVDLGLPKTWLYPRQTEFARCMFFVLKDVPADCPSTVRDQAASLLHFVTGEYNKNLTKEQMNDKGFIQFCSLLAYDLGNANPVVREAARDCLAILAKVTGTENVADILAPVAKVFLGPIFGKPLRALPFPMQIGYIDAIRYCLGLPHTFLEFNEELTRLLSEALALVDAEDESLTSAHRVVEYSTAEQLAQLRIVCIELLSLTLTTSEHVATNQPQTRSKILAVLFKTLYSRSSKVVDAAYAGLKRVLADNPKIPKDLLQNGLRPILMNLSDHKRLTVGGLEGLGKLLELLTDYFKVEIGKKLLDHFKMWAEPTALHAISVKDLNSQTNIQIMVAIVKVFHLLPPKADMFMNDLMKLISYVETNLRRRQRSPFRTPMALYLNRYPEQTLDYFIARLGDEYFGRFFACILQYDECKDLREYTRKNIDKVINASRQQDIGQQQPGQQGQPVQQQVVQGPPMQPTPAGALPGQQANQPMTPSSNPTLVLLNTTHILTSLSAEDTGFLLSQKDLLRTILNKVPALQEQVSKDSQHLHIKQGLEELQQLWTRLFNETDIGGNADLVLTVAGTMAIYDRVSSCLQRHIHENVISATDLTKRRQFLDKALELTVNRTLHKKFQEYLVSSIINPMLRVEGLRHGKLDGLLDKCSGKGGARGGVWLDHVHGRIWRAGADSAGGHEVRGTLDRLKLELVEMTTILIKYGSGLVADARKDIIKFGWNYIKTEDILSKQSAYVLISYFIAAYDTLAKIVIQIYAALLKTHQIDARLLVKQALDVLAPVLQKRVHTSVWAKWPRKVLIEDGHNVTQVAGVYQFIVRHAALFFEHRDHFVPFIVSNMPKLCFSSNTSVENQTLAVDLAELILKWEQMAKEKGNYVKDDNPSSNVTSVNASGTGITSIEQSYYIPFDQREACITFLIRYVCLLPQKASYNSLGKRVLDLLRKLLSQDYWPDVVVKFSFFERSLLQNDLSSAGAVAACVNALEVISVTLENRSHSWIVENIDQIERLLDRCIRAENQETILDIVFVAGKDSSEEALSSFVGLILSATQEHLSNGKVAAGVTLANELVKHRSTAVDTILPALMKGFGKLCKDHFEGNNGESATAASAASVATAAAPAGGSGPNATNSTTPAASTAAETNELILKMLDIGSKRISYLGDQRRVFLSIIAQMIERSHDRQILGRIVDITGQWVFSTSDLFPTTKEKAALLSKMMNLETRNDPHLVNRYYNIIVGIYQEPRLVRSELSARMEHAFLVGTRLENIEVRQTLMAILNNSVDNSAIKRLAYIIIEQTWEFIGDSQWLNQALQILWGSVSGSVELDQGAFKFGALQDIAQSISIELSAEATKTEDTEPNEMEVDEAADDHDEEMRKDQTESEEKKKEQESRDNIGDEIGLEQLVSRLQSFVSTCKGLNSKQFLEPLVELQYYSRDLVHELWIDVFPQIYSGIPRKDRGDMVRGLVTLLAKDYHNRQIDARPNVVQTMVAAIAKCEQLPPQLVKYLGITFNAWYPAIEMLENVQVQPHTDSPKVHESTLDALTELYAGLQDEDMFYGVWRRRARYSETNSALSFEQCGMWSRAQEMHEMAQIKARSGALPFSETEYSLWEDHWVLCAEKLQQWDVLTELAKHEGFTDLLLECGWRVADWTTDKEPLEQSIRAVMDVPTPRRQMFETFLCLQGYALKTESLERLSKQCDEGIQLALRKWYSLPNDGRLTGAHIPLLHGFQQYVEFMEASQVYTSLATTTASNLDAKSQELKGVLQAWRERLPNIWEDINLWGDLVTWRQHAFGVINKVYLPLVPQAGAAGSSSGGGVANNSYAYRGFHEMAWIINRFAHVARKHNMPEVCVNQLTRIYTLPNIEIQEAFLKLREQAKCHYQNNDELHTGLDVISNTNLVYFGAPQKAEFFTLKGMFLAKLGAQEEANQAFATAVQIDLHLPKAWAEWGLFNDRKFKESNGGEGNMGLASNAISCYLQAAGLYKNSKARRLLGRILWLIGLDDGSGAITQAFESYRGEVPVWYWITYIPQLLTSLAHKEARLARHVLIKIAKSYPQALHFHLRTSREEYNLLQRQAMQAGKQQHLKQQQQQQQQKQDQHTSTDGSQQQPVKQGSPLLPGSSPVQQVSAHNSPTTAPNGAQLSPQPGQPSPTPGTVRPTSNTPQPQHLPSQPWEYVEEIMGILKTAYPLLALSLETIVDQISSRFKATAEEEAYRFIHALLSDILQFTGRMNFVPDDAVLPGATEGNITKFSETVFPPHIRPAFERDFIKERPKIVEYIRKLRIWRDRLEDKLDARQDRVNLESMSPPLCEFHYQKFEDVEVPGQYFELKDNNMHFIKIDRFLPSVDIIRGHQQCNKRISIRGNDGSIHPFAIQSPTPRYSRREERVAQLFKMLNGVIQRRKETRQRHLTFTLPVAIPLTSHVRIIQDDASYVCMHAIYEDYCRRKGQSRDEPINYTHDRLRAAFDPNLPKPDLAAVKMEILCGIQATLVPPTVMKNYFVRVYPNFADFFLFRKQFAYQYAGLTFMTFLMSINNRHPHKYFINLKSGNIWGTEMLPKPVPFRLTPNIQTLMGPTVLESLYAMSIMVIAQGLTEPEFDLDQYLCVFVRDELISWYTQQHRASVQDQQLREIVRINVEAIVKRASSLAQVGEGNVPVNQTVIDFISQAVNSRHLAVADILWMPYF